MHLRRIMAAAGITAALVGTSLVTTTTSASAVADTPKPTARGKVAVALAGLSDNKPVNPGYNGNLIFGSTLANGRGALQEYVTHGRHKGSTHTITTFATAPSDVTTAGNGAYWILFGAPPEEGPPPSGAPARVLYKWAPVRHALRKVADLGAYAVAHPDPYDLENNPGDSNPYGLAALGDGSVLVADAAANAVRRVSPSGTIQTVVHLPVQTISTAAIGDPSLPSSLPAEAVPTSVAVGPDGAWYVAELKGFPFAPGASRIWRIKPGTQDVTCDPTAAKTADCSLYVSSLTSIIDITFGQHALYVLELAKNGVGAIEGGDPNSPPPPRRAAQAPGWQAHRVREGPDHPAGRRFRQPGREGSVRDRLPARPARRPPAQDQLTSTVAPRTTGRAKPIRPSRCRAKIGVHQRKGVPDER